MLHFVNKNRNIFFDEFTRHYSTVPENIHGGYFADVEEYYKYINEIDWFDVIYYNITKRCNMHCSYCYSHNMNQDITKKENEIILSKIASLNCKNIVLIGGEPFCNPDFWKILEEVQKYTVWNEITIVTNGTLIGIDKIKKLKDPRIVLQISLDDFREDENAKTRGKGQAEKVLNILPMLKENHVKVRIMKVLTRESIRTAKDFYRYFKKEEISVGFFIVKKVEESLKPTVKQLKELMDFFCLEEKKDVLDAFGMVKFADNMMFGNEGFPVMHCGAGVTSLSIHPDGNVYPCVKRYSSFDYITNIFEEDSIEAIKNNRKRILETELVNAKESCTHCIIKYFCGGGCRAEEQLGKLCKYNCEYYNFALRYYAEKMVEK